MGGIKTLTPITDLLGEALARVGEAWSDALVLTLLALPFAFLLAAALLALSPALRPRSRRWALYAGDAALLVLLACSLYAGERILPLVLLAKAAQIVLYGLVCALPAKVREKKPRAKRAPVFEEGERECAGKEETLPPKVRCFGEEDVPAQVKDVRTEYAQSVLGRLREMPLGAGDRLEAEKFAALLSVYSQKTLTEKEAESLNDILAALLKMMAKYDL